MNIDQAGIPFPGSENLWETKGVFSDHYMRSRLKDSDLWPDREVVKPLWGFSKNLWEKKQIGLAKGNEALTEQELLEPVMTALGFAFLPKKTIPGERKEPDFLLFADEEAKDSVFEKSTREQYEVAISVVEAKKVNHPLGAPSKKETPGKFPHQQIREYLEDAIDERSNSYFDWAILTNGNLWRLYCRHVPSSSYFEFDFARAVQSLEDFCYFVALFRPEAFVRDSEGKCPLDYLRGEALQVQSELEDDLRERVFTILEELANGFYHWEENGITEKDLPQLYKNCLIFLYRLLFVLYCEGRGLLPARPRVVKGASLYLERFSLTRLQSKVRNPERGFDEAFPYFYEQVLRLFRLINGDDKRLNDRCRVPRYNGGLFSHREHPQIDEWRIGEFTVARVLRGLMYSQMPTAPGGQRSLDFGETIDYADLEVRQLGSIYEGLLEHHLEVEDGRVVLKGDKSERKATGTYYTPDYIVRYIVEKTLQPLCDRIDRLPGVQKAKAGRTEDNSFADEILRLNILDPAMGSGHFLVRATEFLADEIVYHPTTTLQIEEVKRGLSHEEAEIAYWRRRVVESCIYGVDLNPLAVELAKLSLWLTCIAVNQPLSFLDHHFRPGNSLVGANLSELGHLPVKKRTTQIPFAFGPNLPKAVSEAIGALQDIEGMVTKDVTIVKEKETRWKEEVRDRLTPYKMVADSWTSTFFELDITDTDYQHLAKLIISNPRARTKEAKHREKQLEPYHHTFKKAAKRRFFHWDFEFPEVFFGKDGSRKENGGFDAVIGNPPYVRIQQMKKAVPLEVELYRNRYEAASKGNYDVYVVFVEKGLSLLNPDGILGFILPHKFFTSQYGRELRRMISAGRHLSHVVHFGAQQVFAHGTTYTCLLFLTKSGADVFSVELADDLDNWRDSREAQADTASAGHLSSDEWHFVVGEDAVLFRRLWEMPYKLGDVADIFVGLQTSADDVYIMDFVEHERETLRLRSRALNDYVNLEKGLLFPLISGTDVKRYCPLPKRQHIIFPYHLENEKAKLMTLDEIAEKCPNIVDYLIKNRNRLEDREKGKFKTDTWYRYGRSQNIGIQHRVKICVPRLVASLHAGIDQNGDYFLDNVDVGGISLKPRFKYHHPRYLLGLINSKLLRWFFPFISAPFRGGWWSANKQFLSKLPFRTIEFSDSTDKSRHDRMVELVDQMLELHKQLTEAQMETDRRPIEEEIETTDREIDQLVHELYGLTEEEIKIVEEGA